MSMLGASLGDLSELSGRLTQTSGDVETSREEANALTSEVVSSLNTAAASAFQRISSTMDTMDQSVRQSVDRAQQANWTGANADRFRIGAQSFHTAINQADTTTRESFETFKTSVQTMTENLDAYVQSLAVSLSAASNSAQEMSQAVEAQRSNLDSVMNTGISVS